MCIKNEEFNFMSLTEGANTKPCKITEIDIFFIYKYTATFLKYDKK